MANQNPTNQTNQNPTNQKQGAQAPQDTKQQVQNAGRERNTLGQTESQTSYWREQFKHEPYYTQGEKFEDYEPAYRIGAEARTQHPGQKFNEVESTLRSEYETNKGSSKLDWDKARPATQAAWQHAEKTMASSDTDRQSSQR